MLLLFFFRYVLNIHNISSVLYNFIIITISPSSHTQGNQRIIWLETTTNWQPERHLSATREPKHTCTLFFSF